jgi:tetratricopeptide (TPR) repeat protein
VFKEALGMDLAAFDTQFLAWVDNRSKGIDEKKFMTLVSQGQETLSKGDADKAIELLSQAVEMYPEYTDEHNPYVPLADAYLKKDNKTAAIDVLKKFMTYAETSFEANVKLADLLKEQGDLAGAQRALEGAIYIRPMDFQVHDKLGPILFSQKQYAAAAREYESLIALNTPDKAGAYYRLAESHFEAGDREQARVNVRKSLEIAPTFEPALELLLKIRK